MGDVIFFLSNFGKPKMITFSGNHQNFDDVHVGGRFFNNVPRERNYQNLAGLDVRGGIINGPKSGTKTCSIFLLSSSLLLHCLRYFI